MHAVHRYAKANIKYMRKYDPNAKLPYLIYWGFNDLCGWEISQKLPLDGFN